MGSQRMQLECACIQQASGLKTEDTKVEAHTEREEMRISHTEREEMRISGGRPPQIANAAMTPKESEWK